MTSDTGYHTTSCILKKKKGVMDLYMYKAGLWPFGYNSYNACLPVQRTWLGNQWPVLFLNPLMNVNLM